MEPVSTEKTTSKRLRNWQWESSWKTLFCKQVVCAKQPESQCS